MQDPNGQWQRPCMHHDRTQVDSGRTQMEIRCMKAQFKDSKVPCGAKNLTLSIQLMIVSNN